MNALFRKGIAGFLIIFPTCFFLNFKQPEPVVKTQWSAGTRAWCCSSGLPNRYGIKFTSKMRGLDMQRDLVNKLNDTSIKTIPVWFNPSYHSAGNIKNIENSGTGHFAFSCIKDK